MKFPFVRITYEEIPLPDKKTNAACFMKPEFYCLPSRHQHLVSAARFTFGDFSAFHPGAEL